MRLVLRSSSVNEPSLVCFDTSPNSISTLRTVLRTRPLAAVTPLAWGRASANQPAAKTPRVPPPRRPTPGSGVASHWSPGESRGRAKPRFAVLRRIATRPLPGMSVVGNSPNDPGLRTRQDDTAATAPPSDRNAPAGIDHTHPDRRDQHCVAVQQGSWAWQTLSQNFVAWTQREHAPGSPARVL
jgi:hypothetical protein